MRIKCIMLTLMWYSAAFCQNTSEENASAQFALKMTDFMKTRTFDSIAVHFDSTMKRRLNTATIERMFDQFSRQFGELIEVGTPKMQSKDTFLVAVVPMKMERYSMELAITTNPHGKIAGLFMRPAKQTSQYNPPSYANQLCIGEKVLPIQTKSATLPGKLTLPCRGDHFPVVVLVHGSGPQDMDVTVGPNKFFKDLTYMLAKQGIATYRYDKRTKAAPESIERPDLITVKEEVLLDVYDALKLVHSLEYIDTTRIFLLGHSLGGFLMMRAVAESPVKPFGVVLMAAPARPLEDIILDQMNYLYSLDSAVSDEEQRELNKMRKQVAGVKALKKGDHVSGSRLPLNLPSSYWLDLRSYDPLKALKKSTVPVLVLQGGRDYQVTDADFSLLKKAAGKSSKVTFHTFENLNHLFLPGKGTPTPLEYEESGNVPFEVGQVIANWLLRP